MSEETLKEKQKEVPASVENDTSGDKAAPLGQIAQEVHEEVEEIRKRREEREKAIYRFD